MWACSSVNGRYQGYYVMDPMVVSVEVSDYDETVYTGKVGTSWYLTFHVKEWIDYVLSYKILYEGTLDYDVALRCMQAYEDYLSSLERTVMSIFVQTFLIG